MSTPNPPIPPDDSKKASDNLSARTNKREGRGKTKTSSTAKSDNKKVLDKEKSSWSGTLRSRSPSPDASTRSNSPSSPQSADTPSTQSSNTITATGSARNRSFNTDSTDNSAPTTATNTKNPNADNKYSKDKNTDGEPTGFIVTSTGSAEKPGSVPAETPRQMRTDPRQPGAAAAPSRAAGYVGTQQASRAQDLLSQYGQLQQGSSQPAIPPTPPYRPSGTSRHVTQQLHDLATFKPITVKGSLANRTPEEFIKDTLVIEKALIDEYQGESVSFEFNEANQTLTATIHPENEFEHEETITRGLGNKNTPIVEVTNPPSDFAIDLLLKMSEGIQPLTMSEPCGDAKTIVRLMEAALLAGQRINFHPGDDKTIKALAKNSGDPAEQSLYKRWQYLDSLTDENNKVQLESFKAHVKKINDDEKEQPWKLGETVITKELYDQKPVKPVLGFRGPGRTTNE